MREGQKCILHVFHQGWQSVANASEPAFWRHLSPRAAQMERRTKQGKQTSGRARSVMSWSHSKLVLIKYFMLPAVRCHLSGALFSRDEFAVIEEGRSSRLISLMKSLFSAAHLIQLPLSPPARLHNPFFSLHWTTPPLVYLEKQILLIMNQDEMLFHPPVLTSTLSTCLKWLQTDSVGRPLALLVSLYFTCNYDFLC